MYIDIPVVQSSGESPIGTVLVFFGTVLVLFLSGIRQSDHSPGSYRPAMFAVVRTTSHRTAVPRQKRRGVVLCRTGITVLLCNGEHNRNVRLPSGKDVSGWFERGCAACRGAVSGYFANALSFRHQTGTLSPFFCADHAID